MVGGIDVRVVKPGTGEGWAWRRPDKLAAPAPNDRKRPRLAMHAIASDEELLVV
jgi:hypothetical protein